MSLTNRNKSAVLGKIPYNKPCSQKTLFKSVVYSINHLDIQTFYSIFCFPDNNMLCEGTGDQIKIIHNQIFGKV